MSLGVFLLFLEAFLRDVLTAHLFDTWWGVGLTAILLCGSCALGLLVISADVARPALRALAGIPLFIIFGGSLGMGIYLLGGTVQVGLWAWLLASVLVTGFAWWFGCLRELAQRRELGMFVGLFAFGFVFAWVGWGEARDGTIRALPGAWGDGPLHVLMAEAFRRRVGPDLTHPLFVGEFVREPFGYDFVAAVLRETGLTVGAAFSLPAAGLYAALLAWVGRLAAQVVDDYRSRRGIVAGILAGVLVLAFSGLQWLVMAVKTASWSFTSFFGPHVPSWAKQEDLGLVWEHHLVLFSSQKHLLLAAAFLVALAVILLNAVRQAATSSRQSGQGVLLPTAYSLLPISIATGFLPLFHMHAFLAAGLLWIGFFLARPSRHALGLGLLAFVIALPSVAWFSGLFGRSGFLSFGPGWMAGGSLIGWGAFWLVNLGVFLPLAVIGLVRTWRTDRATAMVLGVPAVVLFAAANFVQFQPYRWDNLKIFLLAWLLVLPLVIREMLRSRLWWRLALTSVLVATMFLTTLSEAATLRLARATAPVYRPEDRAAAARLDRALPRDAVVLGPSDTVHNHPLTLTGRRLVSAYLGWAWTRNFRWQERAEQLAQLRSGIPDTFCRLTAQLGITHIVDDQGAAAPVADQCARFP